MQAQLWPALITFGTILLMFGCAIFVGRARGLYKIDAPATTGPEGFERAFRVQMNTLENAVVFLPTLWLAAAFANPTLTAVAGGVWLLARVWYAIAYAHDAKSRGKPFALAMLAWLALLLATGWGLIRAFA